MDELRELYQELILEHNRNARNFHELEDSDVSIEGYNPLCGDHYTIYLKVEDGRITALTFTGTGCAISKASASIMCSELEGKTVEEALDAFERFKDLLTGEDELPGIEEFGRLAALGGVREFPMRVKCATLAWHTLKAALSGSREPVTTE
jgi:nitrogen fixation NifU-like protein